MSILQRGMIFGLAIIWLVGGCVSDTNTDSTNDAKTIYKTPSFQMDSAFAYVAKQVAFGPRYPNSDGHNSCRDWLVQKLGEHGATVVEQEFGATTYTGHKIVGTNIIGRINPDESTRILLGAHWDTRFIAEEDKDEALQGKPILGADDGASGVGVLLEIARQLQLHPIPIGVDIIFFDAEDQGERGSADITSWCLGAQHWSKNPHIPNYSAKFGILLDMVGAKNAQFPVEDVTQAYNAVHVGKVTALYIKIWRLAQSMGKGNYFINNTTSGIVDDHYFVNVNRGIPMVDIIHKPIGSEHGFGPHWHTHQDNLDVIDKRTLRAVGQVVLAVLYNEASGLF